MSLYSRPLPPGFIAPCLPTSAPRPPSDDGWLHEIKHDGFRVIARCFGQGGACTGFGESRFTPRYASFLRTVPRAGVIRQGRVNPMQHVLLSVL